MAITPRILVHNPAAVAVAAMTAFGLAVTTWGLMSSDSRTCAGYTAPSVYDVPCVDTASQFGENEAEWSEWDWVVYTECYGDREDFSLAQRAAGDGLEYYPRSEALINLKGLNEIRSGHFDAAQTTLNDGLRTVRPSTGTMENNLAWAILWTNSGQPEFGLNRARTLYQSALNKDPNSCELLHTGLMVEYASTNNTSPLGEAEALKNFQLLRRQYRACESRNSSGQWHDAVEVTGAYVMYHEVDRRLGMTYNMQTSRDLRSSVDVLSTQFPGAGFSAVCAEAMPTRLGLRGACERTLRAKANKMRNGQPDARVVVRNW